MALDQAPQTSTFRMFISYRRDDSSGYALGLQERLKERFGDGNVFMDVEGIRPGTDFVDVIGEALEECDVLLAVIGSTWMSCLDAQGRRRLEDPEDFVRLEVETALRRGIPVLPLLVQGASVPQGDQLPPSLSSLARRQALELSDRRWRADVGRLIEELEHLARSNEIAVTAPEPSRPASNLPVSLDNFVGREAESNELLQTVATARLLTLVGTGGIGKTRLAVHVADSLVAGHPDGVWFVDLTARDDDAEVAAQVAEAIGVEEVPGRSIDEAVVAHLRSRTALVLLDNCEHVLAGCAALAHSLLRGCPGVRILATSREPLHLQGETVWHTPPLGVPPTGSTSADDALRSDAARLFLDRATSLNGAFELDAESAVALARLCRRLDGMPLAIELAAARTRALSIPEIAARLDDRFRLLASGARTMPARHQALRATLDWTYDALSPDERQLFARLAVFAGGFTLRSAESVCSSPDLPVDEVFELLSALVDKSLVVAQRRGSRTRYHMLETIAAYSAERLAEADDLTAVHARHLDHFLALAERVEATLRMPDRAPAYDVLARELDLLEEDDDNLRRALGWALDGDDVEKGLRLAGALAGFWFIRHHCTEGRAHLEHGLRRCTGGDPSVRAKALVALAAMDWMLGDYRSAVPALREALALYRQLEDALGVAEALNFLGAIDAQMGEVSEARAHLTEALDAWQRTGARRTAFESLDGLIANLGSLSLFEGDYVEAGRQFQEALAIARDIGDDLRVAEHLFELGRTACAREDYPTAESLFDQALAVARRLGYMRLGLALLVSQAHAARIQGKVAQAAALLEQGLTDGIAVGDRLAILRCLEELRRVALSGGRAEQSALVTGAADAIREELAVGHRPAEADDRETLLSELRAELGPDRLEDQLRRGRAMLANGPLTVAEKLLSDLRSYSGTS